MYEKCTLENVVPWYSGVYEYTCVYMCVQMVVADWMVVAECTINNVPLYLGNRGDFDKPTSVVLISRSGGHVR